MSGSDGGAVLVTGAAGLVGHAVRLRLEQAGKRVIAVDRAGGEVEGRRVLSADVTDPHALYGLALRERITGVVHCGALSGPMVCPEAPERIIDVNVGGTANVLKLARQIGGVRVVYASSTAAVGPTPAGLSPVPEAVPLNPATVYGASKAAGECLVTGYALGEGVDAVSLRLSWIYGPRRTTACSIQRMLSDALNSRPTELPARADARRQYLHVDDAAEALVLALQKARLPQHTYNITGGSWLTLQAVADEVRAVTRAAEVHFGSGDPDDEPQGPFDISAARRDFGYAPRVTLGAGLRTYSEWLAAERGS